MGLLRGDKDPPKAKANVVGSTHLVYIDVALASWRNGDTRITTAQSGTVEQEGVTVNLERKCQQAEQTAMLKALQQKR